VTRLAGSLGGGGAAVAVSTATWPLIVAITYAPITGDLRSLNISPILWEFAWGVPIGVLAGASAGFFAALARSDTSPVTGYAAWLSWGAVLGLLVSMNVLPLTFAATMFGFSGFVIGAIGSSWTPRPVSTFTRASIAGSGGFLVYVMLLLVVILIAWLLRPGGLTLLEWRRYMLAVDTFAAVALVGGLFVTIALLRSAGAARYREILVSLATFGAVVFISAPVFGFLSACYVGDVLVIFRWLRMSC
jgi:hypothetical protein